MSRTAFQPSGSQPIASLIVWLSRKIRWPLAAATLHKPFSSLAFSLLRLAPFSVLWLKNNCLPWPLRWVCQSNKQISTSPAQRILLPALGCRSIPERQPEPEDCQPDHSAAVIVGQKLKHKKILCRASHPARPSDASLSLKHVVTVRILALLRLTLGRVPRITFAARSH